MLFRSFHPGQTRYGWKWIAERHGGNLFATIPKDKFKGPETTFTALDRTADGQLGRDDFDWSDRSPLTQQSQMFGRIFYRLNRDGDGRVKCVACYMCATACPAHCIDIVAAPAPAQWKDREKYPETFVIDELRCIYCGMCEEACPVDAIELTSVYDIVGLTRQEMIFDKSKLLRVYDETVAAEPM